MAKNIALSYLIVTKNKLPYLKTVLAKLLAQKKEDENIYIADGASTDGTKEYLESLYKDGKIDYFVSEHDNGVTDALNKLILIAQGTVIKFITDDDSFHYPTIEACKKFMLEHTDIDLINTEGGVIDDRNLFKELRYIDAYREFKTKQTPFSFCELGVMFRRSSLPTLGLRDPSFRRADMEMSLQVTSGNARIAWYTGYSYVNIMNPQSVSVIHKKRIKLETDMLNKKYLGKNPDNIFIEKLKVVRNKIRLILSQGQKNKSSKQSWKDLLESSDGWLEKKNREIRPEFVYN